MISLKRPEKIL